VEWSGVCGADSSWPELHAASDPQDDWSEPPHCLHLIVYISAVVMCGLFIVVMLCVTWS